MHGMIFGQLKKYVDARLGGDSWPNLLRESGLEGRIYLSVETYPDTDILELVGHGSKITGIPIPELLEDFGDFIVDDLFALYGSLAKPEWRTLDLLEHIEGTIHRVVRTRNPGARPPEIKVTRTDPNGVRIVYNSPRKMCALAKGIIQGVARYFGEEVTTSESSCMNDGAEQCEIIVRVAG